MSTFLVQYTIHSQQEMRDDSYHITVSSRRPRPDPDARGDAAGPQVEPLLQPLSRAGRGGSESVWRWPGRGRDRAGSASRRDMEAAYADARPDARALARRAVGRGSPQAHARTEAFRPTVRDPRSISRPGEATRRPAAEDAVGDCQKRPAPGPTGRLWNRSHRSCGAVGCKKSELPL